MRSILSLLSVFAASLVLSGCSFFAPYRIDIQQGNYIDDAMLAQLKPGMTREQVRFALGSPLVVDVFHSDRWDYVYRFKSGRSGDTQQRAVSVFFVNDKLDHVEGDTASGNGAAENRVRMIEVPKTKN